MEQSYTCNPADRKKSYLKGASKSIYESMSKSELRDMTSTMRKGKPGKGTWGDSESGRGRLERAELATGITVAAMRLDILVNNAEHIRSSVCWSLRIFFPLQPGKKHQAARLLVEPRRL